LPAISRRFCGESAAALAFPPFNPPNSPKATASGFFWFICAGASPSVGKGATGTGRLEDLALALPYTMLERIVSFQRILTRKLNGGGSRRKRDVEAEVLTRKLNVDATPSRAKGPQ
jgi:hypothetical protein